MHKVYESLLTFIWRHRGDDDFVQRQLQHLTASVRADIMKATCGSMGLLHDDILETWSAIRRQKDSQKIEFFQGVTTFWADMGSL